MLPKTFKEANEVMRKPHGMTDERCMDLPVWVGMAGDSDNPDAPDMPAIISCWALSKEDLERIQKTGVIWLSIAGARMPPVSLFTENPFNPNEE